MVINKNNIQGVCGALDGAVTPPEDQDMIELVKLILSALGKFSPYGEFDEVVTPPDELVTPELQKLVKMGHCPSGELDGAPTLPDGRDTTKTVETNLKKLTRRSLYSQRRDRSRTAQTNTTAKLPLLKQENGNSFKPAATVTADEKTQKKNEVLFCEQLAILKRDISYKDSEISILKSELEKLKQEKESNQLKIEKFVNASKSLDKLIVSQIPDKSRKGLGFVSYNAVPPPPTRLFSPPNLDLSNTGLEEFQQPKLEGYGPKTSKSVSEDTSNEVMESRDASLVKELVSNDKLEKKTVFSTVAKINFVRPQKQEKPVSKPANCNYHQRERMVSGNNYTRVNYNYSDKKAHPSAHRKIVPRAVLMKTGLRPLNTAWLMLLRPQHVGFGDIPNLTVMAWTSRNLMEDMLPLGEEPKEEELLIRVLVVKPHNKTPYELFRGRTTALSFMRPFGCHVTILNTLDPLEKFDGKSDEGFFIGYSMNSKAFRVYNIRTRKVEENLHVRFLEDKPIIVGDGPSGIDDQEKPEDSSPDVNTAGQNINTASINTGSLNINIASPPVTTAPLEATHADLFGDEIELDMSNITNTYLVPTTPNTRIHKDHSLDHVNGNVQSSVQTRRMTRTIYEQGFISIEAMQDELLQFKLQKFWTLVDISYGKRAIRSKSVYRNKKDERGIVIRNKARLAILSLCLIQRLCCVPDGCEECIFYGKIEEEVYVCQPPGFEDLEFPDKVYKVEKALYGLHQAPKARSIIGSLMYLTSSRPDIMFANSPFDLEAYTDSDYAGASLDRKSTTGGCQFLRRRLISWQCKKQTIVANSTTEAEYVAASS
ncbi:putative ribonuclease H-like domain-containing protein [Tanacetum coccineum]